MDTLPIGAAYDWTAAELIKAKEDHWRAICRPVFRVALGTMAFLACISGWGYYQLHGLTIIGVVLPIAGGYWLFLRKYDKRWAIRRHFNRRPDRGARIQWELFADHVEMSIPGSEAKTNWSQFVRAVKTPSGFLLYPNEGMFYWIPFHAFSTQSGLEAAESLLRSRIGNFKTLG